MGVSCPRVYEAGPSPRAWGLRGSSSPPCAGRTGHPHVRGDYYVEDWAELVQRGPSPRAWGLPGTSSPPCGWRRAIPTCVGTTGPTFTRTGTTPGHPHVRGDYIRAFAKGLYQGGPSPRAWGLLPALGELLRRARAIPTCVGTTPATSQTRLRYSGHPHVRGDYGIPAGAVLGPGGPSPRAWGLPLPARRRPGHGRAIPTCVGTTIAPQTFRPGIGGPSPRAWGLRVSPSRGRRKPRAIPTCVGTTLAASWSLATIPGHPHVRGDYARRKSWSCCTSGPSPRAWGLLPRRSADLHLDGPSPRAWGLLDEGK